MVISKNFDYSSNPIGYVDLEGGITLKLNPKEQIKAKDITSGKVAFAPSYIISKEKDGIVQEVIVNDFSLIQTKKL